MATQLFANNASAALASAIISTDTTIVLATGYGALFPSPSSGDWFLVTLVKATGDLEIVKCTARTGDSLTVVRAQEGTTAKAFILGDVASMRWTKGSIEWMLSYLVKKLSGATNGFIPLQDANGDNGSELDPSLMAYLAANETITGDWTFNGKVTLTKLAQSAYNITGTVIDPANGSIQYKTLSGNVTFTESLADGDVVKLLINAGSNTVTWPTITWMGGSKPVLSSTGFTEVDLVKIGSTLYGVGIGAGGWDWESAEIPATGAAAEAFSADHPWPGTTPSMVAAFARCKNANNGAAVGDEVMLGFTSAAVPSHSQEICSVGATSTKVYFRHQNLSIATGISITTITGYSNLDSKWAVVLRARA